MRIAITGATGFVGSHLVRHLAAEGHKIMALGRSEAPAVLLKYAQYIRCDLTEQSSQLLPVTDIFIHCAGHVDFWGDYQAIYRANVKGTEQAMSLAQSCGAKHFIYISTANVYGSGFDKHLIKETAAYPERYGNNYAKTKALAEQLIVQQQDQFEATTVIRPHAIYGPGDRSLFPRILSSVRGNRSLIIGSGENRYSITHVGNIGYGISQLLAGKKKGLQIYNLTDSQTVTVNEIFSRLMQRFAITGKPLHLNQQLALLVGSVLEPTYLAIDSKRSPLLTKDIVNQLTHESTLSIDKIKKELNYQALYSYEAGLVDFRRWVESIGGLEEYLKNPKQYSWQGKLFTY